jgi:hypothetical protein
VNTLSKPLKLAHVTANVEASSPVAFLGYTWGVRMTVPGPDYRYNPAVVWLPPSQIDRLVELLGSAEQITDTLTASSFDGDYFQDLPGGNLPLEVAVITRNGAPYALLSFRTSTQSLSRHLSRAEIKQWKQEFASAAAAGATLVSQLQVLNETLPDG